MPNTDVLDALLDSWDRNNAITVNLLRALPEGSLACAPPDGSPTVAEMFTHMHYVRVVFVFEDAPEIRGRPPDKSGRTSATPTASRRCSRRARRWCGTRSGRAWSRAAPMDRHYDHPILMLQHLIWHEGYHQARSSWRSRSRAGRSTTRRSGR